jgi:hypothetical protein
VSKTWSIFSLFTGEFPELEWEILRGEDANLDVMDLVEFRRQYPDDFKRVLNHDEQSIAMIWAMEQRASQFNAQHLDFGGMEKTFPDLASALRQIIQMAVGREAEKLGAHIGDGASLGDMGILAALALRPEFYIFSAFDVGAMEQQAWTAQQGMIPEEFDGNASAALEAIASEEPTGATPVAARVIEIYANYGGEGIDDGGGEAVLRFRKDGEAAPWQLSDLELLAPD